MKTRYFAFTLAAALAAALPAAAATSKIPTALLAQAAVSPTQARAAALRTVHGVIQSEELEKESGGSGLRYTFDIKTPKGVREVGVDAKTGKVLENTHD